MFTKVFCKVFTTFLQGVLQGFYNIFTRCSAGFYTAFLQGVLPGVFTIFYKVFCKRLMKHIYKVVGRAFTTCLQGVLQGLHNMFTRFRARLLQHV